MPTHESLLSFLSAPPNPPATPHQHLAARQEFDSRSESLLTEQHVCPKIRSCQEALVPCVESLVRVHSGESRRTFHLHHLWYSPDRTIVQLQLPTIKKSSHLSPPLNLK